MDSFIELLPEKDRVLGQLIIDVARLKGWTNIGLWPEHGCGNVCIEDLFGTSPEGKCSFISKTIVQTQVT